MASFDTVRFVHRLAPQWESGCWIGLIARAIAAAKRDIDGTVVGTPDHFLGAAWPPVIGIPARWPEAVVIGSPSAENALAELLTHVPADARLLLVGPDEVDMALAAEILLHTDRNLEAYQREGLAAFINAERTRMRKCIAERYTDVDAGYERFRGLMLGEGRRER